MWTTIAAVATPVIVTLLGVLGGTSTRLSKRIAHHADLLAKLKDVPAASAALSDLLTREVAWLDEKETQRHFRKINWGALSQAVGLAMITFGATALLYVWSAEVAGDDIRRGVALALAIVVSLAGALVVGILLSRTFTPRETRATPGDSA